MNRSKIVSRAIAFLVVFVCICASFPLNLPFATLAESFDAVPFGAESSFAEHQVPQMLTEPYDNAQILHLRPAERRVLMGRRYDVQTVLFCGQEVSAAMVYLNGEIAHTTISGKGHLSVLALSLGGNSPPEYHA